MVTAALFSFQCFSCHRACPCYKWSYLLFALHDLYSLQVQELIVREYTVTQRIPNDNQLACKCISDSYNGFGSSTVSCVRGYTAVLSNLLWMGSLPRTRGEADEAELEVPCGIERVNRIPASSVTNWVEWNARLRCVN